MRHVSVPLKSRMISLFKITKITYFRLTFFKEVYLSFDGESYQSAGSSEYSHRETHRIANYLGKALTTGCSIYGSSTCAVKTELMDMETLTWSSGPDYPFTSS